MITKKLFIFSVSAVALLAVLLAALAWRCSEYRHDLRPFESIQYGISLLIPASYASFEQKVSLQSNEYGEMPIEYLRFGVPCRGECPYLFVSRESIESAQPRMSRGTFLSLRTAYGSHVIRLDEQALGDMTVFFVRKGNEVVVLEFGFPPSDAQMRRILQSVRIDEDL